MPKSEPSPGDVFPVRVNGVTYETVIDEHGVQRFRINETIRYIMDTQQQVDFNHLMMAYQRGAFPLRDYMEFYMQVGYSVDGFAEIFASEEDSPVTIQNPLWALRS